MVDVRILFILSCSGRGEGVGRGARLPGGGQGRGAGRVSAGNWGGGGLNMLFCGAEIPPSRTSLHTNHCKRTVALEPGERMQSFFNHCELVRPASYCTKYCNRNNYGGDTPCETHPSPNSQFMAHVVLAHAHRSLILCLSWLVVFKEDLGEPVLGIEIHILFASSLHK